MLILKVFCAINLALFLVMGGYVFQNMGRSQADGRVLVERVYTAADEAHADSALVGLSNSERSQLSDEPALHPTHQAARSAFDAGEVELAYRLAGELVVEYPENAALLSDYAVYAQQNGDAAEAEKAFRTAIRLAPAFTRPRYNLATLLLGSDQYEEAITLLTGVIAEKPFDYSAHYNLGLAYSRVGNVAMAVKQYRRAVEVNRAASSAPAHHNMGVLAFRAGIYLDALDHFRRSLYLQPEHQGSRYNAALCFSRTDQTAEAIDQYRKLIAIAPTHQRALINLAIAYLRTDRPNHAAPLLRRVVALDPQSVSGLYHLGLTSLRLQQTGEAEGAFARAVRIDPTHAKSWHQLSDLYRANDRLMPAREAAAHAYRLRADRVDYAYAYAELLLATDMASEAEVALTAVLTARPDHRKAAYNRGLIRYRLDRYADALEDFRLAQSLRPLGYNENYMVGLSLLKLDQPRVAIDYLTSAMSAEATIRAAFNLALAYERSAQLDRALAAYRAALRIDPKHRKSMERLAGLYADVGDADAAAALTHRLSVLDYSSQDERDLDRVSDKPVVSAPTVEE